MAEPSHDTGFLDAKQMGDLSRALLSLDPGQIDDGITLGLALLGQVSRSNHCFLFDASGFERGVDAVYRWYRDEGEQDHPVRPGERLRDFRWLRSMLRSEGLLCISRVVDMPEEAARERDNLLARGVRSVLGVYSRSQDAFTGFLCLEYIHFEREWTQAEIDQLQLLCEIFIAALRRKRAERVVEQQILAARRVSEISRLFVDSSGDDLGEKISRGIAIAGELAGAERCFLITRNAEPSEHPDCYEWCADPAPGPQAAPEDFPWPAVQQCEAEILEYGNREGQEAGPSPARTLAEWAGARALLGIPIHSEGSLFGHLQFTTRRSARRWSKAERATLSLVAEVLGGAVRRKQTEDALQTSQHQLLQTSKMEAVGRLAGGIAHDFNNLLTVIVGNARMLLDDLPPTNPSAQDAEEILAAAERAGSLTRQLLAFSSRQDMPVARVDVNGVVTGLEGILARLIPEDIELVIVLHPEIGWVDGNAGHFEQILMNLVVNARLAMPEGGRLVIRTDRIDVGAGEARRTGLARAGQTVVLSVSDDGCGMPQETMDRIFEPFFTTREQGEGTGLGLSIVYRVVRQFDGAVVVRSKPGRGTTFDLYFPQVAPGEAEEAKPAADSVQAGGRILVAEDDPAVRRLACKTLERAGYEVLRASDGLEALGLITALGEYVDLLITDVVMPRMGGRELARELRSRFEDLPVLYISGYPREEAERLPQVSGEYLQKPFTGAELLRTVAGIVQKGANPTD